MGHDNTGSDPILPPRSRTGWSDGEAPQLPFPVVLSLPCALTWRDCVKTQAPASPSCCCRGGIAVIIFSHVSNIHQGIISASCSIFLYWWNAGMALWQETSWYQRITVVAKIIWSSRRSQNLKNIWSVTGLLCSCSCFQPFGSAQCSSFLVSVCRSVSDPGSDVVPCWLGFWQGPALLRSRCLAIPGRALLHGLGLLHRHGWHRAHLHLRCLLGAGRDRHVQR